MVQKTALLLWNRRGAPVCVVLLMLCFDPVMGDRGESAHGAALLWPGWALVTRLKLALLHIYLFIFIDIYVYILHSCYFWDGGVDLKYEIRQWQPNVNVNHAVSQEL